MPSPLRVGVVGLGIRGFWIAHMTRECPDTELVAMADLQEGMRAIAREKFPGVALYPSGTALVQEADVDAVVVATADRFHYANAREALEHGRHVLIEKPMAQSFEDLVAIARLQRQTGLTVGTFLEMRQHPMWQHAYRLVHSGAIGKVLAASLVDHVGRDHAQFFARQRTRSRDRVVSLVLQKGVHSLDLLNWVLGCSPRRVAASGGLLFFGGSEPAEKRCSHCGNRANCPLAHDPVTRLEPIGVVIEHGEDYCVFSQACDVEDITLINIEYAGGVVASYREVHFAPYYGLHFTLYGSRAQLDLEMNHDTGEAWVEVTERFTRKQRREHPESDAGHGNADAALLSDFATACREGRSPLSDLRAGFESAAIAIGARRSLDTSTFVDLPLLDEV